MIFNSKDKVYGIEIIEELLQEMETYALKAGRKETGGILIGTYECNLSVALVRKVSGPPPDSEHGPTWFKRGIKGLKELLDKNWEKGYFYLGEWHFHPYASPSPSRQDIQQMKSIASNTVYNCPEPILIIIGGEPGKISIKGLVATKKKRLVELSLVSG